MQTLTLGSNGKNGRLLDMQTSLRLRAFRFVSKRYEQRERPGFAAELILFALIVMTSTWPMFSLASALSTLSR